MRAPSAVVAAFAPLAVDHRAGVVVLAVAAFVALVMPGPRAWTGVVGALLVVAGLAVATTGTPAAGSLAAAAVAAAALVVGSRGAARTRERGQGEERPDRASSRRPPDRRTALELAVGGVAAAVACLVPHAASGALVLAGLGGVVLLLALLAVG